MTDRALSTSWPIVRTSITLAIATLVVLATLPDAGAQDYPSRPVKIIVPFPAGGTADVMPRIVSDWLRTAPAPPATSAPKRSPSRSPTGTPCSRRRRRPW